MASAYFKKPRVNISAMSRSRCATTVGRVALPIQHWADCAGKTLGVLTYLEGKPKNRGFLLVEPTSNTNQ